MDEDPSEEKNLSLPQNTSSDLAKEWNLFWQGLRARNLPDIEEGENDVVAPMTLEQIKVLSKALSGERKNLNRRLEALQKEIELNTTKLDTLKLVGSDQQETLGRLNELHDQGINISNRLQEIDDQIKEIRGFEERLSAEENAEPAS